MSIQTNHYAETLTVDGGVLKVKSAYADQSKNVNVPVTGFTLTIGNAVSTQILNPAGTLATGTVTMCATPADGQCVYVCSSQAITALTVSPNSGQTLINAPSTLALGSGFGYIYDTASTTWFRLY